PGRDGRLHAGRNRQVGRSDQGCRYQGRVTQARAQTPATRLQSRTLTARSGRAAFVSGGGCCKLSADLAATAACRDCDLLQEIPPLPPGGKAHCARCGYLLARNPSGPRDLPLALTITAAIVYVLANTVPLMDLSVVGRFSSTTVAGGAYTMWQEGEPL